MGVFMFDSVFAIFDAQAFSLFMIGWLVALLGSILHIVGGGFRDGHSKVPVLGNWVKLERGEKGFTQQIIAKWIFRIGALMAIVGGVFHFT